MKINWGTGIVLTIVAFIAFIMFFVVRMMTENKFDHDLVTNKYYEKELNYQQDIDAAQNSVDDNKLLVIKKVEDGVQIEFPKDLDYKSITGKVFLYRPSNEHLDFEMPISISKPFFFVPDNRLLDGRWNIQVSWNYNDKAYKYSKEITY
ncbi:MAG: cytochrome C oxidase Cbb3 [Flavobacteriaceae bacterium]|nr:cytochrome C oxidase Cbb3 [Flavobacteriaceae bacterium]|tara:strand:- start:47665 stop:48111 length:447 start_codon:yes stop_codon:yes gene_type:complete